MSSRPERSEQKRPSRQGTPQVSVRVANLPSVLPDRRPTAPATKPAAPQPIVMQKPKLVNWPLVIGAGAAAWLLMAGVVVAGWMLSRPTDAAPDDGMVEVEKPTTIDPVPEKPVAPVKVDEKKSVADPIAQPKPKANIPDDGPKVAYKENPGERDPRLPPDIREEKPIDAPKPFDLGADPIRKKTQTCGTSIEFFGDPDLAFAQAKEDKKVVFVIHVAGNFEDSKFT